MDCLMTVTADNQGLPPSCGHNFDPSRFLPLSLFLQVGEFANVVGPVSFVPFGDRPSPALRIVRAACHRTRHALYPLLERLLVREYPFMESVMPITSVVQRFP